MSILWIFLALFHLVSISFMGLCIMRLFSYKRRHKLVENRHTLLFRFICVEQVVTAYVVMIALFTIGTTFLLSYLASS